MKKQLLIVFTLLFSLFALSSCIFVPTPANTSTGTGVYVSVKEGEDVTKDDIVVERSGKACTKNFLYVVNIGDSSIGTAMSNGNITEVSSVNKQTDGFGIIVFPIIPLPLVYSNSCTVVKGK